jgi:tripartite-type tricarboxylate transporter receptor subunit TctC
MTSTTNTAFIPVAAVAVAGLVAIGQAAPVSAADLSGRTVEFVIPFAESGGSARWAQFFAPLLSQHLPGQPTVVVRYRPGGGSTTGANWFAEQTTDDGTLIFGTSGSTQFPYLLGDPRVRYDYNDWTPLLASGTGGVAYLAGDLADKWDGTADNLQDEFFLYGSQGATSLDLVPLLAFKLLGLDVEPVFGVEGRGDGRLMFERGEANLDYQTSSAYISSVVPMVEQGLAVPLFSWGALDDDGNIVRDPTFPDIPSFKEVCEATAACETEGVAWEAWQAFFIAGFPAQKIIYLPGTASEEVVQMYETGLREMLARDDFAELSEAELGVYPQMVGEAARNAHRLATTISEESKQYVLDWLRDDYQVVME